MPHSGSVFPELAEEPAGYEKSSGALRFPVDQPQPRDLVEKLIAVQLQQAFPQIPGDRIVKEHPASDSVAGICDRNIEGFIVDL